MRSRPSFLVVSRSEYSGGSYPEDPSPDEQSGGGNPPDRPRWFRRDNVELNELNVSIKISYKTLVLIFVLFDVFHKVIDVAGDSDLLSFMH